MTQQVSVWVSMAVPRRSYAFEYLKACTCDVSMNGTSIFHHHSFSFQPAHDSPSVFVSMEREKVSLCLYTSKWPPSVSTPPCVLRPLSHQMHKKVNDTNQNQNLSDLPRHKVKKIKKSWEDASKRGRVSPPHRRIKTALRPGRVLGRQSFTDASSTSEKAEQQLPNSSNW